MQAIDIPLARGRIEGHQGSAIEDHINGTSNERRVEIQGVALQDAQARCPVAFVGVATGGPMFGLG